jgi:hypothetical protein
VVAASSNTSNSAYISKNSGSTWTRLTTLSVSLVRLIIQRNSNAPTTTYRIAGMSTTIVYLSRNSGTSFSTITPNSTFKNYTSNWISIAADENLYFIFLCDSTNVFIYDTTLSTWTKKIITITSPNFTYVESDASGNLLFVINLSTEDSGIYASE